MIFKRSENTEQKITTFYDESYWTDGGEFWEMWCSENGTAYSREDCYILSLEYFGYPITVMTDEDCWNWSEDELESIAREFGIVVDFVCDETKGEDE